MPQSVFSVDSVPARDRYEVWRESISCIFDVDADRPTRRENFRASVDAHMFGPMLLARTTSIGQRWARSAVTAARDGMDHYMIQLYESGSTVCEHSRGVTEIPRGGLLVFDLAQSMTSRTNDFTNISLVLPRDMLDGMLRSPDDQHMRALTGEQPMVALLREHLLSLKQHAGRISMAQAAEIAPATAALLAACLNGTAEGIAVGDGRPTLREAMTRQRCKRFIDASLSRPDLSPQLVAKEMGVSRTRLYQLFDGHGGIAHYIRERRLRRALLALADTTERDRPIYEIALASGFTSDAAFSRMFRQRYGVTPRDVRRGVGSSAASGAAGYDIDRRYETWLNRLTV